VSEPIGRRAWLARAGAVAALGASPLLGGCERSASDPDARRRSDQPARLAPLRVWAHQGREAENAALRAIAEAFERAQAARVELGFFPDQQYTERLSIAAAARDLPDAFEVDGPLVARFVDAGLLAPLGPWFTPAELDDFLPSIRAQGSIAGVLFALGAFDSAAVLYHDRRRLEAAGVRWRDGGEGPSWPELLDACARLAASGIQPLSLHMGESADEWFTYAFSPVIWSAGGRLIDVEQQRARGVLASRENIDSLRAWQLLFTRGFASSAPADPDPFGHGAVALDWSGHWMARSHAAAKGEALGVTGLPRRGPARASACGSYCWGVHAGSARSELAAAWVRWVTGADTGIQPLVSANGAEPARRSAFALFPEYARTPYALFREQLEHAAHPRPKTPFYATLTRELAAALRDIAHGAKVEGRLRRAEDAVQAVIDRRLGSARGRPG
jgi:multiple sugar transport system substrate-binding protein